LYEVIIPLKITQVLITTGSLSYHINMFSLKIVLDVPDVTILTVTQYKYLSQIFWRARGTDFSGLI